MPLVRLLYTSQAVGVLPYGALRSLMAHAQDANRARGVTGMLCYGSGQFLQALEGDRPAVTALYHAIARDPRHEQCELVTVEEIESRDFPEWSMKVVNWADGDGDRRRAQRAGDAGRDRFDPRSMRAREAVEFLRHLAVLERELARDE